MSNIKKRVLFLGLVSFIAISMGACRDEEQGRLLSLEPGKYLGNNPDTGLTESQRASLRNLTGFQSGATAPVGGGSKPSSSSMDSAQMLQLRLRARSQAGSKL